MAHTPKKIKLFSHLDLRAGSIFPALEKSKVKIVLKFADLYFVRAIGGEGWFALAKGIQSHPGVVQSFAASGLVMDEASSEENLGCALPPGGNVDGEGGTTYGNASQAIRRA